MASTPALPSVIAYFDVTVPTASAETPARAEEIVQRYLYGQFTVVGVILVTDEFDKANWLVRVRYERARGEDSEQAVDNQRARLSSGLYASTKPVFYRPEVSG
jgi:hypothetical protein